MTYGHFYTKNPIFRGSKLFEQANSSNARIVFNMWMKIFCSERLPEVLNQWTSFHLRDALKAFYSIDLKFCGIILNRNKD